MDPDSGADLEERGLVWWLDGIALRGDAARCECAGLNYRVSSTTLMSPLPKAYASFGGDGCLSVTIK